MFFFYKLQEFSWNYWLTKFAQKKGYGFSKIYDLEDLKNLSDLKKLIQENSLKQQQQKGLVVSPENIILLKSSSKKRMQDLIEKFLDPNFEKEFLNSFQKIILIGKGWEFLDTDKIVKTDGVKKYIFTNGKVLTWIRNISGFNVFLSAEGLRPFSILWVFK